MSVAIKDRRKISNLAIDTRAQLRLLIPFSLLLAASFALITILYWQTLSAAKQSEDLLFLTRLSELQSKMLITASLGILFLGILCSFLWIIYSHRIFGPIVQLQRQIENLNNGKYDMKIKLRAKDEFKEVAASLNQLAETLKAHHETK